MKVCLRSPLTTNASHLGAVGERSDVISVRSGVTRLSSPPEAAISSEADAPRELNAGTRVAYQAAPVPRLFAQRRHPTDKLEPAMSDAILPFRPATPSRQPADIDVQLRIATALEYIATQLGQINARLQRAEDAAEAPPPDAPAEVVADIARNDELESLIDRGLK
jgi:hypothetical protein